MESMKSAVEAYRLENRMLPDSLDQLVGPTGYLVADEVPRDAWDNPFFYEPDEGLNQRMVDAGVLAVEMETAALYSLAVAEGKRALSVVTTTETMGAVRTQRRTSASLILCSRARSSTLKAFT